METMLVVVARYGKRCGLDEFQIATAQSLAWYYSSQYEGELADSHWARQAIRHVLNGRDLPGCGTGPSDVLNQSCWQAAGMGEVKDQSPGPDKLAADKEAWEMMVTELNDVRKTVVEMKIQGIRTRQIARVIGCSDARISQLCRDIAERFA